MPEPGGNSLIVLGAPNAAQKNRLWSTAFKSQEVINILCRIQWPRVHSIQLELVAKPVGMQGVAVECVAHPFILLGWRAAAYEVLRVACASVCFASCSFYYGGLF